jgi:hypothetical protein
LDGFLKAHEVWLGYSVDDLERERAAFGDWVFGIGNWKWEVGIGKSGDERRRSGSQKPHPLRAEGAAPGEGVKDDGGVPALPKAKSKSLTSVGMRGVEIGKLESGKWKLEIGKSGDERRRSGS